MGKSIDLTGQTIGKLTILERKRENNRTYYYCRCDCKNEVWIRADRIKTTKSCGCLQEETQFKAKDISNKRFGRLVALSPTKERDENNGSVIWECICDCENTHFVSEHNLTRNGVQSCGCLGIENSKNNMQKAIEKHLKEHIIQGTNIPVISRKEVKSNNTSGVTGVTWDKDRKKWLAAITFKKKIYYLGRYVKKEDAIKARKEAEEKYHKNFLQWYNQKYKKENSNMFSKDVIKLLNIDSLIQTKNRKEIIKRLIELEQYREHLRQETLADKDSSYREKCMNDLKVTSDKMKALGSLLDDFETIKKIHGINGVF